MSLFVYIVLIRIKRKQRGEGKMAENLVNCTQYQTEVLNPKYK